MRYPMKQWPILIAFMLSVLINDHIGSCERTQSEQDTTLKCEVDGLTDQTLKEGALNNKCSYDYIYGITISDSTLKKLPRLFEKYLNLKVVNVTNCGIQEIDKDYFNNAKWLMRFHFYGQNISRILEYQFFGAHHLSTINLVKSNIEELDVKAFEGLRKLEAINLAHNRLHSLPDGIFDGLPKLKTIQLNNNRIKIISNSLLSHNTELEIVNLDSNDLIRIEQYAFQGTALATLIVSNNMQLDDLSLQAGTFQKLTKVDVSNTKLKRFTVPAAATEIYAVNSSIMHIEGGPVFTSFGTSYNVKRMELCSNNLTNLAEFTPFKNLEVLDVSQNKILQMDYMALGELIFLRELNVAFNPIEDNQLNIDALMRVRHLRFLKISNDQFQQDIQNHFEQVFSELKERGIDVEILSAEQKTLTVRPQTTTYIPLVVTPPTVPTTTMKPPPDLNDHTYIRDFRDRYMEIQVRDSNQIAKNSKKDGLSSWQFISGILVGLVMGIIILFLIWYAVAFSCDPPSESGSVQGLPIVTLPPDTRRRSGQTSTINTERPRTHPETGGQTTVQGETGGKIIVKAFVEPPPHTSEESSPDTSTGGGQIRPSNDDAGASTSTHKPEEKKTTVV